MKSIVFLSSSVVVAAFSFIAPLSTHAQTFLFDFGSTQQTNGQTEAWNNVTNTIGTSSTGQLLNLVATDFTVTGVNLLMVARFNGENLNGTESSGVFPATATHDSLYGNTEAFNSLSSIFPRFKLTGLDTTKTYDFTFYASRGGVTDNRETVYTVTGGISGSVTASVALNVANNVNQTAGLFGIVPNPDGEILIALDPGANNNNANHFTYLGVMSMVAVPEPSTAACLLGGMGVLLARRRRSA